MTDRMNQIINRAALEDAEEYFIDNLIALSHAPRNTGRATYSDTFFRGGRFALSHQWIPVEERLPEDDRLVLAHFSDVDPELCYATAYYKKGVWSTPDDWYYGCKIDCWMPIPEPQLNTEKEER